jgi:hypothetical protein
MRQLLTSVGTLCLLAGFTSSARAGDKPQLELIDPDLPIYELLPLDRRVHGLTLEGTWNAPAKSGSHHYVNILFPNGRAYSTRVDEHPVAARKLVAESKDGNVTYRHVEDSPFRRGEVRCLIPNHQIIRNGLAQGGKFKIVVSVDKSVTSATAKEVVSNVVEMNWPLDRAVAQQPPRSRHSDPEPVDAMPRPSAESRAVIRAAGG